jgi:hypothetical protein
LVLLVALLPGIAGCTIPGRAIHLPSTTIAPGVTDPAFVAAISDPNRGGELLVCIVRFDHALSRTERAGLRERLTTLKGSRGDTWFVRASAAEIASMLSDARVLWVGEYRSAYKRGRRAMALGDEPRWMRVVSFAGNRPEFRTLMTDLGIEKIRYDPVLEEYEVRMNARQRDALFAQWWVREIYRAGGRGLGSLMGRI